MRERNSGRHRNDTDNLAVYKQGATELLHDPQTWKAAVYGGRIVVSTVACTLLFVTARSQDAVHNVCMRMSDDTGVICAEPLYRGYAADE